MARTVAPLTDTQIKKAKQPNTDGLVKDYTLADGNGLHLLIKANGAKLWEFIYKSPSKNKRRKSTFGNYPQTTLSTARILRKKNIDLIKQGIDPIDQKKEDSKNLCTPRAFCRFALENTSL